MKVKVLFVCLGNICRSPMAEAVFAHQVRKAGLEHKIEWDSAGTAGYHIGKSPDRRTLAVLLNNDITTNHRGRKLSKQDVSEFTIILAMDKANFSDITEVHQSNRGTAEVTLFREFDSEISSNDKEVPDPYYGTMNDFELVYEQCQRSSAGLLKYLKEKHQL